MEQIMNYVKPELIVVTVVLYFIGMGLKQAQPGFFPDFTQHAVEGRFAGLHFSADAYPLALVNVNFFLNAVQHQHLALVAYIANGR